MTAQNISGGGALHAATMSAAVSPEVLTRAKLAMAIRHEMSLRRFAEEPERVVICLLRAGLDRGLNGAMFPTQRDLAIVARMSEKGVSDALAWLVERNVARIGKRLDGVTAPQEWAPTKGPLPEIYFLLPPGQWDTNKLPIRRRYLPITPREKEVWQRILHPSGEEQRDALPEPYGITEALQDSFDSQESMTAGSAGVASPLSDQVRAMDGAGTAPEVVSPDRPQHTPGAGAEFTALKAAARGESRAQFARVDREGTSGDSSGGKLSRWTESVEEHCARVQEKLRSAHHDLPPGGSPRPVGAQTGSSPWGKIETESPETHGDLPPGGRTRKANADAALDDLPPGGSPRAPARVASLAQIGTEAKLANTQAALEKMRALSPSEFERFGNDGWIQAAEKTPKQLLSVLAATEEEMAKRQAAFEQGKLPASALIHNPLAYARRRAMDQGIMRRSARRRGG